MPAVPAVREIFGGISIYSLCIVAGIIVALWLCLGEEKRIGLPKDAVIDCTLWALPLGIIGARLYYVAFTWADFSRNPIRILYVWEGGLAIYGAVIGGALGVYLASRRRGLSFPLLADVFVPALVLAQAIGRWGNYFNMEAFGAEITNPALQFFPFAVQVADSSGTSWHMATFFYESCWAVLCFAFLWHMRTRKKRQGDLLGWYLLTYGAGRTIIEGLRTDSLMALGGNIRISQWLSLAMCIAALTYFIARLYRRGSTANRRLSICVAAISTLLIVTAFLLTGSAAATLSPGLHTLLVALNALWFPAAAMFIYKQLPKGDKTP